MMADRKRRFPFFIWGIVLAIIVILAGAAVGLLVANNRPVSVIIPTHSVPKDNGLDYLVRAGKAIKYGWPGRSDTAKWTMADYETFMKSNKAAFSVFRQGLAKPCVCPALRGLAATDNFPRFAVIRELARAISGEAVYYEKKGDYGRAVDSQLDCTEMGVSMPRGGGIIHGLTGMAVAAIGYSCIGDNLARLSPTELARAASHMERIQRKKVPYSEILLEESYSTASQHTEMLGSSTYRQRTINPLQWMKLAQELNTFSTSGGTPTSDFAKGAEFALSNKNSMISQNLKYAADLAAETQKPYSGKSSVPVPDNLLMALASDVYIRGWECYLTRQETKLALIQTEIALRRFNADNGQYPAKLQQLVPQYVKSVPVDPFGIGKPLRYKLTNGGKAFLLYSLGLNLKDDGGTPGSSPSDWRTGDITLAHPK